MSWSAPRYEGHARHTGCAVGYYSTRSEHLRSIARLPRRNGVRMSAATVVVDETLQLRLKAMHLPSFLEHHVELAQRAAAEGWSHVRYLVELVALEASERSDRRMTRLLRD